MGESAAPYKDERFPTSRRSVGRVLNTLHQQVKWPMKISVTVDLHLHSCPKSTATTISCSACGLGWCGANPGSHVV